MCGIVGYVGKQPAVPLLLSGLRRLEYRGYDSAGIVTVSPYGRFHVTKRAGRIDNLQAALDQSPVPGCVGVGHTRWATHGPATDVNAHPHEGGNGVLALVHNGVIENYRELKEQLESEGYCFRSATDSEAIAHLLAAEIERNAASVAHLTEGTPAAGDYAPLAAIVRDSLERLQGTFGLAIIFRDFPQVVVAARRGSPLVVGAAAGEHFLASDAAALAGHADRIVHLADHEVAVLAADSLYIAHRTQGAVARRLQPLALQATDVERGRFAHYMLKEIYEQPESLEAAMRGRLNRDEATAHFGGLNLDPRQLRDVERIVLTACGTSWHAALVGEYLFEELARVPVEVEYASELRYRNPPMSRGTLAFCITQSGETADTLAALRELRRRGHPTLAICNVVGSTIAQEADGGVFLHAGPEIGVASTKAFTSQCLVLAMLALHFGRLRDLSFTAGAKLIEQLESLPDVVRQSLSCHDQVRRVAEKYAHCDNFLYLGRQYNFPTALEGALKLKEISYIHAEGYPAAEMKHGPIALVDERTPSVFLNPQGVLFDKVMANMEEIKARGGPVIVVTCEAGTRAAEIADDVILVPSAADFLQPIIAAVPLQLFAYHIALHRGCDVDKPRNLAKSVTVE